MEKIFQGKKEQLKIAYTTTLNTKYIIAIILSIGEKNFTHFKCLYEKNISKYVGVLLLLLLLL